METCDKSKVIKRKFVKTWLSDDRYKSWISEISSDTTLYYCKYAIKIFRVVHCMFPDTRILRVWNKNKLKGIQNPVSKHGINKKFRHQWLDIKDFQPWLREMSGDDNSVFYLICDKPIHLTIGSLTQIHRHAESKMHRDKSENNDREVNKLNEDLNTQDEFVLPFDERKKSGEIRLTALIAETNIPHQTANKFLKLFQKIGEESKVLKAMSRTKCKNIISNVLYLVETDRVVNNIQNS